MAAELPRASTGRGGAPVTGRGAASLLQDAGLPRQSFRSIPRARFGGGGAACRFCGAPRARARLSGVRVVWFAAGSARICAARFARFVAVEPARAFRSAGAPLPHHPLNPLVL